jgi:hypothetical protein
MTVDLDDIAERIERVALDPDRVSAPLSRILRPILARLGVEPELRTVRITRLVECIRMSDQGVSIDEGEITGAFEDAKEELETNVSAVERACVVNEQPMVTHGAWLRRMYEILVRASRAVEERDESARRMIAKTEAVRLLLPLTIHATKDETANSADASARRVVDLELASVDRLMEAADAETEMLGRKRRLLEAARQTLLSASATMPLDGDACGGRLEHLAQQISRIDRLEAAGVSPDTALTHQLRQAATRGERERAYAALCAMQTIAVGQGDEKLLSLSSGALTSLGGLGADREASLARSANQMFGVDLQTIAKQTYEGARKQHRVWRNNNDPVKREAAMHSETYFTEAGARGLTAAAISVDGCFDVGGAMIPMRIEEHEMIVRAVRHPTKDLALMPALDVEDLPDAVIEDPRSLVLDLAAGRLLARRFIAHEDVTRPKTILRGEVRAYVLDGSGSMIGPRARMRDAILASELLTLRRRMMQHAKLAHVVLYYRYFAEKVEAPVRVDTVPQVDASLAAVLGTIRTGGTNIEAALVATLRDIATAKARDPDLARAQVVIVTDGQAPVAEKTITKARETLGDLPIGLSVIALGEQNDALRAIVSRQRSRGERAFYHFISDAALGRIVSGDVDPGGAIHPPPVPNERATPVAIAKQIGELVEEIAARGKKRDTEALEALDERAEANAELGIGEADLSEAEKARARALYRDRAALERQFDRWFPPPPEGATTPMVRGSAPDTPEDPRLASLRSASLVPPSPDIDSVTVLLSTVAEMIGVVGGSDLSRMADAIDLLERLLPDARLTPARYHEVLAQAAADLAKPLAAVRQAANGRAESRAK